MQQKIDYIIWGSAGHAKVLASIISEIGGRVIALFDNDPDSLSILSGVPLYKGINGFEHWLMQYDKEQLYSINGFVAIGGDKGHDRLAITELLKDKGIGMSVLVHPSSYICKTVKLGFGTQVLAKAVVASDSVIGNACIVNHCASVDHESRVGDGVHIAPGSTICGCVNIDNYVMVGAGAVVLPRLTIGKNTIIGAGSVVTHDLPENVIVYGNPAKIVRRNK